MGPRRRRLSVLVSTLLLLPSSEAATAAWVRLPAAHQSRGRLSKSPAPQQRPVNDRGRVKFSLSAHGKRSAVYCALYMLRPIKSINPTIPSTPRPPPALRIGRPGGPAAPGARHPPPAGAAQVRWLARMYAMFSIHSRQTTVKRVMHSHGTKQGFGRRRRRRAVAADIVLGYTGHGGGGAAGE